MSKQINVYLVDRARNNEFQTTEYTRTVMESIRDRVDTYLERICKDSAGFSSANVTWNKATPSDTDIVVHVFYSPSKSIIYKVGAEARHMSASGGTWKHGDGMISEVFLEPIDGAARFVDVAANIIFHEMMHNKLDVSDPADPVDIHTGGGGGLAADVVSAKSVLTDRNIALMAAALSKSVPQYKKEMKKPKY